MAGIEVRGISRRYGSGVAVEDVSFAARDGEFLVLVGPSGCGKTTTLRIVAGLERAGEGQVLVGGRDVTGVPAKDRNLAMVFQSYALYPHMTVAENIGFALRLQGLSREAIGARVKAAAERLEIGALLSRRPRELSGGQRQRVAVARCIVREPLAFLFDEPLSNLDAKLRAQARVEIAKLQKALGITTLYVTHDQVEAMTMADRILLMDRGRIVQEGPPMELYARPRNLFVAGFLGAPPMNLIAGAAGADGMFRAGSLAVPLPLPLPEGPATLGLRPEALSLSAPPGAVAFTGRTQHVERLGAETVMELGLAGGPVLTARLPGVPALDPGGPLALHAAPGVFHLFDGAGVRLGP